MKISVMLLLFVFLSACSVVGPGQRGVRISMGSASEDVKEPGVYLWIPFIMGMTKFDVQIQKSDIKASSASKDMQEVKTDVAVNWSITPSKVVDMVKKIGDEDDVLERIIQPAVSEILKSAMAKKTAEELLSKRMELKKEIDESLTERLAQFGVTLEGVNIVDFTFSPEFTRSIEEKQIAEQSAKKSEYVAQQAVQEAKAEVNRAKGQAESQSLIRESLTAQMLQKIAIEKWDGHFPQVMGSGAVPFLNLNLVK